MYVYMYMYAHVEHSDWMKHLFKLNKYMYMYMYMGESIVVSSYMYIQLNEVFKYHK